MTDNTQEFESQWLAGEEAAKQQDAEAAATRQAAADQTAAASDEYVKAHAELEGQGK